MKELITFIENLFLFYHTNFNKTPHNPRVTNHLLSSVIGIYSIIFFYENKNFTWSNSILSSCGRQ